MGRYGYGYGGGWAPYVSVAQRRRDAEKKLASLRKKGMNVQPVVINGRKIANTFWGAAWCDHLESFSDYESRLPRGRTYVRNGSVVHLGIVKGKVEARVSGSELYTVQVDIKSLTAAKWKAIKQQSAGKIGSLLELLQGKLSDQVMLIVTNRKEGLFPQSKEIAFKCDCPDWAGMCKHIAAVMYGIGVRLDTSPELLFTLRGVDHQELIAIDAEAALSSAARSGKAKRIDARDLSDVFGIDLDSGDETGTNATLSPAKKKRNRSSTKLTAAEKPTARKVAKKKSAKRKASSPSKEVGSAKGGSKAKTFKKQKKK